MRRRCKCARRGSEYIIVTRSIFITGASSGIGEGLAVEFARRGWAVAIAARRTERLQALSHRLEELGAADVVAITLDVTDTNQLADSFARAAAKLGRIDVVVVNAGVGYATPVGRGRLEQVCATIDTNLTGAIATIEHALPLLREQGGGQIAVITSIAAVRGLPTMGAYSAAKAGLHRYLQSLRAEVRNEPITVTELAPGYIDTAINRGVASRPFVIPAERGAAKLARLIERGVGHRFVPAWPWAVVAPLLRIMPTAWLVPRPNVNREHRTSP
jgi:NAD(P)-dependent dehydrogenase (short-subunit alcohol dehydrogenase family)